MINTKQIARFCSDHLNNFRHSLAYFDALPQLTLLGLLIGLLTGAVIVVFRFLIDTPLSFLISEHTDNFESLSIPDRFLFIFTGLLALGLLIKIAGKKHSETSVAHVLDRLHNYQGKLPFSNWLVQFAGAIIAMVSGQSVGREGPAVHLGAGVASQLGQWLRLPNNSMHTLIGCGVAAAISASFDTPMAGVIFAMEVIVMEYTIVGFVPVILASVMGTMMSQAAFGESGGLLVGSSDMNSLTELPYMVVVGLVISLCASTYIRLNIFALKFNTISIYLRLLVAGLLTAVVATAVPEVMGLGYDTVNAALAGQLLVGSLLIIGMAKLLITPVVIGLGIPGGVIGPLLVIGGCIGGAMGLALQAIMPELSTNPSFYVVIGMTGMMAATLNAPLAALVAVLELSYNPHMIFPAMLVIVVACVSTRQLFKLQSIFVQQLIHSGRKLDFGPAKQALRRAGVRSIMDTRFVMAPPNITVDESHLLLSKKPMWVLYEEDQQKVALRAADLAAAVTAHKEYIIQDVENTLSPEVLELHLHDIPGRRLNLQPIHDTANLIEALEALTQAGAEGLFVSKTYRPLSGNVHGVITMASIQNYYQPEEFKHAVG
ncbi:chloride channel protein [Teredinibacter purpureus]|uniref:chloride channel protein n=1 Tax=Teredinibacter purpureus TaxID=2731756 RepID=UPI0005F7930D|nr:chloride channel protein [Teredinibacter purpureus]